MYCYFHIYAVCAVELKEFSKFVEIKYGVSQQECKI